MSLTATFLWRKSPQHSICTLIYDADDIKILSPPTIHFFSNKLFSFRKESKIIINNFIKQIYNLYQIHKKPIKIEFKIVFDVRHMYWMKAAGESKYVYSYFMQALGKLKKLIADVYIHPQFRSKLSGKALKHFKRELRAMNLVSRKKETAYEYYLWAVALHVTPKTYEKKLKVVRKKLMEAYWATCP